MLTMRPITRRLRLLAAVLGLAQSAMPALALAHELAAAGYGTPVAHAESQGADHDAAAHSHDCGLCRNAVSKIGFPAGARAVLSAGLGSLGRPSAVRFFGVDGGVGSAVLPRAPPVG